MQPYHQPQPQRFAVFTQLANGKGFRIKNSHYIYMFDKYGGWYDQYNNYYGPDGSVQDPPEDQDYDFQRVINQDQDDQDDFYQKEYGTTNYEDDQEDMPSNDQIRTELAISKNLETLGDYPLKTPLRVDFSNMNFRLTKDDILKHYSSKIKGILNVILIKKEGKFNGEGYFVVQDSNVAQKIVKLQAEEVSGRKIFYDVQGIQDYLMDKITKDQMGSQILNQDDFQPLIKDIKQVRISEETSKLNKKKYAIKQSKAEQQKKQPEVKSQVKQVPKNIISWSLYQGDFYMFPAKNSFFDWTKNLGFIQNQHFKNITMVKSSDSSKRIKRLQIRSDMFQKVQDSLYDSKKFHLQKVN